MTTVTFDTLELVDKLKTAGISQEQAEAVVRVVIAEAQDKLVTTDELKSALDTAFASVKIDLAVLKAEATFNKWMLGFIMAGVLSIVVKTFF
jgi:hypothetical protein